MSQFVRLLDAATDCIDDMKMILRQAREEEVPAVVRLILHATSAVHVPGRLWVARVLGRGAVPKLPLCRDAVPKLPLGR